MLTSLLISLLIIIIVIFLIFKIVHVVIKTIIIVSVLLIIIVGLVSFLAYSDGVNLQSAFVNGKNAFLLVDSNNNLITGFLMTKEKPAFFTASNFIMIKEDYNDKSLEKVKSSFNLSRIFIFKEDALNKSIQVENFRLSRQDYIEVLNSDSPLDFLAQKLSDSEGQSKSFYYNALKEQFSNQSLKSALFASALGKEMQDPMFLFKAYSSNKMNVYPKTILFKVIHFVPSSLLNGVAGKVKEAVESRFNNTQQ